MFFSEWLRTSIDIAYTKTKETKTNKQAGKQ